MHFTLKQKFHEVILHLYLSLYYVYTISTDADLFYSTEKMLVDFHSLLTSDNQQCEKSWYGGYKVESQSRWET